VSNVILNINSNAGYSAEQVADESITLYALLEAVQDAIETHGAEAKVVLNNGGRYGANYGNITDNFDIFSAEEEDDDQ